MLHSKISRTTKMYFSFLRIRKYVVAVKVIKSPFGLDKCHLQHPAAIDKGQLISEKNFGVFKFSQKANQIFDRFLPELHGEEIRLKFGWLFGRI